MTDSADSSVARTGIRSRHRNAVALSMHSAVTGFLAYVFFALVTRTLGAVAAAPVSVLWTLWSFSSASLTFPIQHWITRSVTAYGGEGQVRAGLLRVLAVTSVAAAAAGGVAALLTDQLFHGADTFAVLVGLVCLGSVFVGLVRGSLTARGRFGALGWSLSLENAIRLVAAIALATAGIRSPGYYGLAIVAGFLSGTLWPRSLLFSRGVQRTPTSSPVTFLVSVSSAQLLSQSVLVGAPVLLALLGGSPTEVTALFVTLALCRAPYLLALGVMPAVTARMTRLFVSGAHTSVRRLEVGTTVATVALAALGWLVAGWLGPVVVRLVFGSGTSLSGTLTGLVAAGAVLSMGNLVLTSVLMARDRPKLGVLAWLSAIVLGGLVAAIPGPSPLAGTVLVFVVIEAAAFGVLLVCARLAGRETA
ncbi:MAG: hypothetical protein M3130_08570 [Actinomycetota bacterium]|nr:hypothetical protein [Actinomycetota bacterium]